MLSRFILTMADRGDDVSLFAVRTRKVWPCRTFTALSLQIYVHMRQATLSLRRSLQKIKQRGVILTVTPKSSGKVKPHASKKCKNKVSKHGNSQQKLLVSSEQSSNVEPSVLGVNNLNNEPSVLGVNNLTPLEISQLRELLGFNIQEEGPSIFTFMVISQTI